MRECSGSGTSNLQMIDDAFDSSVPDSVPLILGTVFEGFLQFGGRHGCSERCHFAQIDLLRGLESMRCEQGLCEVLPSVRGTIFSGGTTYPVVHHDAVTVEDTPDSPAKLRHITTSGSLHAVIHCLLLVRGNFRRHAFPPFAEGGHIILMVPSRCIGCGRKRLTLLFICTRFSA